MGHSRPGPTSGRPANVLFPGRDYLTRRHKRRRPRRSRPSQDAIKDSVSIHERPCRRCCRRQGCAAGDSARRYQAPAISNSVAPEGPPTASRHRRQARTRRGRFPLQETATARDSHANREAEPGFSHASRSIQHGQTFFWENGTEQHPASRNFKNQKIFDADWLKRHDSVTVVGNPAADTNFWANEAVRNAKNS